MSGLKPYREGLGPSGEALLRRAWAAEEKAAELAEALARTEKALREEKERWVSEHWRLEVEIENLREEAARGEEIQDLHRLAPCLDDEALGRVARKILDLPEQQ